MESYPARTHAPVWGNIPMTLVTFGIRNSSYNLVRGVKVQVNCDVTFSAYGKVRNQSCESANSQSFHPSSNLVYSTFIMRVLTSLLDAMKMCTAWSRKRRSRSGCTRCGGVPCRGSRFSILIDVVCLQISPTYTYELTSALEHFALQYTVLRQRQTSE